jgi:hypothetical protein
MTGHGSKFERKKEEAVGALLTHRNIEEAADAIGIAAKTLLRWMKEPEFESSYREARRAAFRAIDRPPSAGFGRGCNDSAESNGGLKYACIHKSASRRQCVGPYGEGHRARGY